MYVCRWVSICVYEGKYVYVCIFYLIRTFLYVCMYVCMHRFIAHNIIRVRLTYNSGGAGYVLDTVSLSVVAESLLNEPEICHSNVETSVEDVYMANCLRKFGIHPFESRDASKRERFHHFSPDMSWHYRLLTIGRYTDFHNIHIV